MGHGCVYEVDGRRFIELDPDRDLVDQVPQVLIGLRPVGMVEGLLDKLADMRLGPAEPVPVEHIPGYKNGFNAGLDQGVVLGLGVGVITGLIAGALLWKGFHQ